MQATITRNGQIVGQMDLEESMSLLEVAQTIYDSIAVESNSTVGSQPMRISFQTIADQLPSATVVLPNDAMFEQFHIFKVRDLPRLYHLSHFRPMHEHPSLTVIEIRIEPLLDGLNIFHRYINEFKPPSPVIKSIFPSSSSVPPFGPPSFSPPSKIPSSLPSFGPPPSRISPPPSKIPSSLPSFGPPPSRIPSSLPSFSPPPSKIPSSSPSFGPPPTQVSIPKLQNWRFTLDTNGKYRLLDLNNPSGIYQNGRQVGKGVDKYYRHELENIIKSYLKTHTLEKDVKRRYINAINSGNKYDLENILKEFVPIVYI